MTRYYTAIIIYVLCSVRRFARAGKIYVNARRLLVSRKKKKMLKLHFPTLPVLFPSIFKAFK